MQKGAFYGLIALLALAAVVGVYYYTQQPTRAVTNAVHKLGKAETQQFQATVELGTSEATRQLLGEPAGLVIQLIGSFNRRGDERDSLVSDIDITASTESVEVQIDGEARFVDDSAYLFVEKAPAAVPVLAQLKDKWIALPRGGGGDSEAQVDGPLFSQVKRAGREKVMDESAVKYEALATEHALVAIMDNIAQLLGTSLTDAQIGNIRANLQNTQQLPVTLWITPWEHNLVQMQVSPGSPDGSPIMYTVAFTERNKKVNHSAPEGAISLEEALQL